MDGEVVGWAPDWYPLILAAKYLGVAPWDLVARPAYYQAWAMTAIAAEGNARKQTDLEAQARAAAQRQAAQMQSRAGLG